MQTCSVYGLGVHVNVPLGGLAGLPPVDRVDVAVHFGAIPAGLQGDSPDAWSDWYVNDVLDERGNPSVRVSRHRTLGHYRIRYADETVVVIDSNARSVWAQGPESATTEDTATYILGPVLGFVLRMRGTAALHASCVVIDGKAVAFAGCAGAGKSSIAAAFAQAGHPVLTDDVTPLRDLGERFAVQPAYPRIRLWTDSVESLFGSLEALPRITPTWDKRYLDLNGPTVRFERDATGLRAIYLIGVRGDGTGPSRVEALTRSEALMALVAESSSNRLLDRAMRAHEFEVFARLVKGVPVRRLIPGGNLARVGEVRDTIMRDLAREQALAA